MNNEGKPPHQICPCKWQKCNGQILKMQRNESQDWLRNVTKEEKCEKKNMHCAQLSYTRRHLCTPGHAMRHMYYVDVSFPNSALQMHDWMSTEKQRQEIHSVDSGIRFNSFFEQIEWHWANPRLDIGLRIEESTVMCAVLNSHRDVLEGGKSHPGHDAMEGIISGGHCRCHATILENRLVTLETDTFSKWRLARSSCGRNREQFYLAMVAVSLLLATTFSYMVLIPSSVALPGGKQFLATCPLVMISQIFWMSIRKYHISLH